MILHYQIKRQKSLKVQHKHEYTEPCKGHSRCRLVEKEKNSEGKCDIKMRDAR